MPEWLIVGENDRGEPVVVVDWIMGLGVDTLERVRTGEAVPYVFYDRWAAKRVLRRRNDWRRFRCVRRENT